MVFDRVSWSRVAGLAALAGLAAATLRLPPLAAGAGAAAVLFAVAGFDARRSWLGAPEQPRPAL